MDSRIPASTLISAPLQLRAMVIEADDAPSPDLHQGAQLFKIRAAKRNEHRTSADILVSRMYEWRGYQTSASEGAVEPSDRITFIAEGAGTTIGTMSIRFDSSDGLFIDGLFRNEVDALRQQGRLICEFTRFAVDNGVQSKRLLASLFHVAYIYSYRLKGFDTLLIEVNPRHVRFYKQKLGLKVVGPLRMDPRVKAPAVLMSVDFHYMHEQIMRFGGRSDQSLSERSLYPYFFSVAEEANIVGRLGGNGERDP